MPTWHMVRPCVRIIYPEVPICPIWSGYEARGVNTGYRWGAKIPRPWIRKVREAGQLTHY